MIIELTSDHQAFRQAATGSDRSLKWTQSIFSDDREKPLDTIHFSQVASVEEEQTPEDYLLTLRGGKAEPQAIADLSNVMSCMDSLITQIKELRKENHMLRQDINTLIYLHQEEAEESTQGSNGKRREKVDLIPSLPNTTENRPKAMRPYYQTLVNVLPFLQEFDLSLQPIVINDIR